MVETCNASCKRMVVSAGSCDLLHIIDMCVTAQLSIRVTMGENATLSTSEYACHRKLDKTSVLSVSANVFFLPSVLSRV